MPTTRKRKSKYEHIGNYRTELQRLRMFGGSDNESSIRRAFEICLSAYCKEHSDDLELVPELRLMSGNQPDGTVKDVLRMTRGYWEAKDTHDELDKEIQKKLNAGYPRNNIIFEDSLEAVLIQNGRVAMRVDIGKNGSLHRLIQSFLNYELPELEDFRSAQRQFKSDLPEVLENLRGAIDKAEIHNEDFRSAALGFLEICKRTIGSEVSEGDVQEMLLQHILTKDIFLRVFSEDQFHRENNIALQLDALEQTFFTGNVRRQAITNLRSYYAAIGRAADDIADYTEKQQFLKAIYEDFYKAYNPAAADRLGVVYTPTEIVDFIIRGTDWLLQKHFGRSLADSNVQILDPATGTGTFITNLINHLPIDRLKFKYEEEIFANEVAILPYYIANLNIEYTYKERTGEYLEYPNLSFVDTLDNLGWVGKSVRADVLQDQGAMWIGGISEENLARVQRQNEKPISVIIGNPPYNANQANWNEANPNRAYPTVDLRIRETYIAESGAQKTKQYDMYKRFIRWASDRLDEDGIIGFVSNRAFLDARQDDGFRKVIAREFNELWVIDMKGDARTSGERRRREGGNIFDDKIRVGVAIYFLVRRSGFDGFKVFYNSIGDYVSSAAKAGYIRDGSLAAFDFEEVTPSDRAEWLKQPDTDFASLMPVARGHTDIADGERTAFRFQSLGVSTNRDAWVYCFDESDLVSKIRFFRDTYNGFLRASNDALEPAIKWSSSLDNAFQGRHRIILNEGDIIRSLFRPFVAKHYFANPLMSDRLTKNHYEMFGPTLREKNRLICFRTGSSNKPFHVLATDKLVDLHLTGDTRCLPLYTYTPEGERVSNITEWGKQQFRGHYGDDGIDAEHIFAYTYAVFHDPKYREKYSVDLTREFPRLPFYGDFEFWAHLGQELLDLHIGFESVEPHELKLERQSGEAKRVVLRADKERGVIQLDDMSRFSDVPDSAWRYMLGNRSAIEWVLDQFKERKPRDPTIASRFNTYRFADHKERVIDLLQRVCAVSVRTMEIVDELDRLNRA